MGKFIDLTGQKFGRLTVIERTESSNKNIKWLCECECGGIVSVFGTDLKSGKTQSCGCIASEILSERNFKHGLSQTRLCRIWRHMKERCFNPKCPAYHNYGGRGIAMSDEWVKSFQAFYDWAMENGYEENLTIDRIDNNGNYEPSNCRWVTRKVQANNMRVNHRLTYNGEDKTIAEWSDVTGIKQHTIIRRLGLGWSVEKALTVLPKEK